MATIDNAVKYLEQNETPYWTIHSGTSKVGQSNGTDNLQDSISRFRDCMNLQSPGNYKLVCSKNPNDNRGGLTFSFSKGQQSNSSPASPMQSAPSNNIFGVADTTYAYLQTQFEQAFMMKQMFEWYKKFSEEWPEYKKKIDELYYDGDGDGTPDFLQIAKTASDTMEGVSTMKKAFEGGSGFRF